MIATVADIVRQAVENCRNNGAVISEEMPDIIIERPRRDGFGDFSTNIAMLLAGREAKPPRQIAELIAKEIRNSENVKKVDVAGPGFINVFMVETYWFDLLRKIHSLKEKYGTSDLGAGKKVQVEFVSANPTGPLHIGHGRGAAVGDALANILEASGFSVTREYYINDTGRQMDMLGMSLYLRYLELLGEKIRFPDDCYKGIYIKDIACDLLTKYGDKYKAAGEKDVLPFFTKFAADSIMNGIKKDLEAFGIKFNIWYSEKSLFDRRLVAKTIEELRTKGFIYERENALWFNSMKFGDDKDRVLVKADGSTTYFASDTAYHREKIARGFEKIIDVWGADHHGYEARIRAVLKAFDKQYDALKIVFIQMVSLLREGIPVPMGKREGEFVTLRQVMDEVGKDACRFFFLMRKSDAHLEFDLGLAKKQAPENPVYYVQYAHARICSIIKHAKEKNIPTPGTTAVDVNLLSLKEELDIIRKLCSYPDVVQGSSAAMEPHRITFYLTELVSLFHPYYNSNRVVAEDIQLTHARLYLCEALRIVVRNGLGLLGVSAPEEM